MRAYLTIFGKPRCAASSLWVMVTLACIALWPSWRDGFAHAQEAPEPDQIRIPAPADKDQILIIRVQVEQPYIDDVATYVTYDGWDRVFGITWQSGQVSGRLVIPDRSVTTDNVIADILDRTNAGVSMPARYTPLTAPRLLPHLLEVRALWGRAFDDNAYASAGMAMIGVAATLRPMTGPLATPTVRSAATVRPQTSTPASTPSKTSSNAATTNAAGSVTKPSGVWSKPPAVRGREIETALGSNLIDNFPVIDRFEKGIATSIKSVNLGAKSYQKMGVLRSTVTRYIDEVVKFEGKEWANRIIRRADIEERALELAIPTSGTAAQQAVLKKMVAYGLSKGVEVKIIVYP